MRVLRFSILMSLALSLAMFGCDGDDNEETTPVVNNDTAADAAGGDTDEPDDTGEPAEATPYDLLVDALMASCTGCHGDGTEGTSSCSYNAACFLNDEASLSQTSVMPGCAADSTIAECSLARIEDGTMPPKNTNPAAGDDAKAALQAWIDAQ